MENKILDVLNILKEKDVQAIFGPELCYAMMDSGEDYLYQGLYDDDRADNEMSQPSPIDTREFENADVACLVKNEPPEEDDDINNAYMNETDDAKPSPVEVNDSNHGSEEPKIRIECFWSQRSIEEYPSPQKGEESVRLKEKKAREFPEGKREPAQKNKCKCAEEKKARVRTKRKKEPEYTEEEKENLSPDQKIDCQEGTRFEGLNEHDAEVVVHAKVKGMLRKAKETQLSVKKMMNATVTLNAAVRKHHRRLMELDSRTNAKVAEACLVKPSSSIEEVTKLEMTLKDKTRRAEIKEHLTQFFHREKPGVTTNNFMLKIATVNVWANFSYKGHKGKKSFLKFFPTLNILLRSIIKKGHKLCDTEVSKLFVDFLKHCPQRVRQMQNREQPAS